MPTWKELEQQEKRTQIEQGDRYVTTMTVRLRRLEVPIKFRALNDGPELGATMRAYRWIKEQGLENPVEGDELFDRVRYAETLLLVLFDADSPDDALRPFFSGSREQLQDEFGAETIAYLYAKWSVWNDQCNERPATHSVSDYIDKIMEAAGANDPKALTRYYEDMRLAARPSFFTVMAALLLSCLRNNLLTSSGSTVSDVKKAMSEYVDTGSSPGPHTPASSPQKDG